jgi:antitoxin YefM
VNTLSSSVLRAELAKAMQKVCDDREPLLITRQGADPVVMISLEDFRSLEETAYLLRSPGNAARLERAIESLEKGEGTERKLAS